MIVACFSMRYRIGQFSIFSKHNNNTYLFAWQVLNHSFTLIQKLRF